MATAATAATAIHAPARGEGLAVKDKVTVGLLVFFMLIAWTLEAYWLVNNDDMETRTSILAKGLALYWPADKTYRVSGHDLPKAFTLAVESVNVCVTQFLQLWLIFSIVRKKHYRHVLQLTLATYTWYGTFLYYYVAHISGYQVFEYRGTYPFLMFYVCNAPWFFAYGWMAWDSMRAILVRLRDA
jgi:hypothetical protein